jgi:diguanylate cyclase (GGDEF)-like protein
MSSFLVTVMTLAAAGLGLQLAAAQRMIRDLRRRLSTAEQLVGTDPLTGLANRVGLYRAISATHRDPSGSQVAMLLLDVDRLKHINDEHGHPTGDAVLVEIARRIIQPGAPLLCAARLGGDEFVIALAVTDGADAAQCAEDFARTLWCNVGAPVVVDDLTLRVTASIGIAILPNGRVDQLLDASDKAMYRAKRTGAGICHYEPLLDTADQPATPITLSTSVQHSPCTATRRRVHVAAPPAG